MSNNMPGVTASKFSQKSNVTLKLLINVQKYLLKIVLKSNPKFPSFCNAYLFFN